jgi:hypothetical protein
MLSTSQIHRFSKSGKNAFLFTVIPGEQNDVLRDPWFDMLTTLSEVDPSTKLRVDAELSRSIEGESRKLA